jgi:hypothetical protein
MTLVTDLLYVAFFVRSHSVKAVRLMYSGPHKERARRHGAELLHFLAIIGKQSGPFRHAIFRYFRIHGIYVLK